MTRSSKYTPDNAVAKGEGRRDGSDCVDFEGIGARNGWGWLVVLGDLTQRHL